MIALSAWAKYTFNIKAHTYICFLFRQGARCGEGLRFRNVSCFVSDGSNKQDSSLVDDELCGDLEPSVDGDTHIVLQEPCTVPCPGKKTFQAPTVRDGGPHTKNKTRPAYSKGQFEIITT